MSAKRYQMALEAILAVSTFDGSTMRRIAQVALDVAEPATVTMPAAPVAEVAAGEGQGEKLGADERCGRLLVGLGDVAADPFCWRPAGHSGACWPAAEDDGVGEGADRAGAAPVDEPDAAPQAATPPAAEVGAPPRAAKTAPKPAAAKPAAAKPAAAKPAAAKPRAAKPAAAKHTSPASLDVVALLGEMGEATIGAIVERGGWHRTAISDHLRKAMAEGTVTIVRRESPDNGRPAAVYALKPQADAKVAQLGTRGRGPGGITRGHGDASSRRADVLACIREGDGLDEPEIALQLGIDREHVAMATGDLLADRQVVLQGDGTYIAAESEAAA